MQAKLFFAVIATTLSFTTIASTNLQDAKAVLGQIEPSTETNPTLTEAAQLLADVQRYRTLTSTMKPSQAAQKWRELYLRSTSLRQPARQGEMDAYDAATNKLVGVSSIIAALPAPNAWSNLAGEISKSAAKNKNDLAMRFITELLIADYKAADKTLTQLEQVVDSTSPEVRDQLQQKVAAVRAQFASLYGTPKDIAAAFIASLDKLNQYARFSSMPIPDLVSLVGEGEATKLLHVAFSKPTKFYTDSGDATRALAKRIALADINTLRVPQWGLVDNIEGAPLYEAMQKRFGGIDKKDADTGSVIADSSVDPFDYYKKKADTYYFLSLVLQGRQDEAEQALAIVAGDQPLEIPASAIKALEQAGHNEALYNFLAQILSRKPEMQVWTTYIEQAAYLGHSNDALTLIENLLKRKNLSDYVVADLRARHVDALLANDKIEPALVELKKILLPSPQAADPNLEERSKAALRLAGLGRILKRPELSKTGLNFAQAILALPEDTKKQTLQRESLLVAVFAELRKEGLDESAQQLALLELKNNLGHTDNYAQYGIATRQPDRVAMIELVGIYGATQRYADVLELMQRSKKWGARDLADLLGDKDSLGVPLALHVARALAATDKKAEALRLVQALLDQQPNYDPAYELLVELDPNAVASLDKLHARDQFEERPLIWKATVQATRNDPQAESTIKQAIAIDPSDGEEGLGDRMRAYSVLADILESRGDKEAAGTYRGAVTAIRLSENADELHRLGLYGQAFAQYREALTHFSDAYCIQSRLAVQLNKQGRHQEALAYYRRAYELMPDSFGRVESHCFGCESVFKGQDAQLIAEAVFTDLVKKAPGKAQAHYLLGYLREEQGRYAEALQSFRFAVSLDNQYLNAWKHLHGLGTHIYIPPVERDLAELKLLELDPKQRHIRHDLTAISDLKQLWLAAERANELNPVKQIDSLYKLTASAQLLDDATNKLPEPIRKQMAVYQAFAEKARNGNGLPDPQQAIAQQLVIKRATTILSGEVADSEY